MSKLLKSIDKLQKLLPGLSKELSMLTNELKIETANSLADDIKIEMRYRDELLSKTEDIKMQKELMRVIYEQARSSNVNFDEWYNFNYKNIFELL